MEPSLLATRRTLDQTLRRLSSSSPSAPLSLSSLQWKFSSLSLLRPARHFSYRSGISYGLPSEQGRTLCRTSVAASMSVVSSCKEGAKEERRSASEEGPELFLYNTMSRSKERFRPRVPGKVGMYVCGVTSYDLSHIGHARVYVAFDVLYRYLRHLKYEVKYVRNFTDVDDKIIARAADVGGDPLQLSDRFCKEFHVDMASLQCLPPTVEPRVTKHIDQIIKMIEKILENGFGYVLDDGDVYFSVEKLPSYGRLSGRSLEENRAGERVAVDSRKRNPADFALWKSAKPGEPSWNSPWGGGRPGWHIECSAMSAVHLGPCFDIHGGGVDLVFPHHENEIAQSCAACKDSAVSYWIHNGFVTVDSEKMSKSLGNFFTIREVLDIYHPFTLRLFLIGTHYRSAINYSKSQLEIASDRAYYIYQTLGDCEQVLMENDGGLVQASEEALACIEQLKNTFVSSMSDDLLTPAVLASLSEPLKLMNDLLHTRKGRKNKRRIGSLRALQEEVKLILNILGLLPASLTLLLKEMKDYALKRAGLTKEEVESKIKERAAAREAKDYARSDEIRGGLAALGIALMDTLEGTTWRPGSTEAL